MAFFRRDLSNVLVKGYFKEPKVRYLRIFNSLPETSYSSWTRCESKIVQEAKNSVWGCAFLSARIHRCSNYSYNNNLNLGNVLNSNSTTVTARTFRTVTVSTGCLSSDNNTTVKPHSLANSEIKHNSPESSSYANQFNPVLVEGLIKAMDDDMPITDMPDPFEKEYRRCFLCRNNILPDHKNVRLLSQFVSPYTGRIYGRAITGLCIPMQKHVATLIQRARISGFMPIILKDPKYLQDPQPYDVMSKKSGS